MIRKLLCTLAVSVFCIADSLAVTRQAGTAKEFRDAATASTANDTIRLTADIDLSGLGTIDITFSGTIDGQGVDNEGHAVYHSLGDGTHRVMSPIFSKVKDATFQNLGIRYFRVARDTWGNDDNLGAVADMAESSKFKDLVFIGISVFSDNDNAGAVVGQAKSCTFKNVQCLDCDVTVDGDHAGGLVGYSENCQYTSCLNNALSRVFSDGSVPNAYAGGITGESDKDIFINCVNLALVGANDDRVGGITGYSTKTTFEMCMNSGNILQVEDEEDFLSVVSQFRRNIEKIDNNPDDYLKQYKNQLKDYYDTLDEYTTITRWSMFGTLAAWGTTGMVAIAITNPVTLAAAVVATGVLLTVWTVEAIIFTLTAHDQLGGICGSGEGVKFDCCANFGGCYCRDEHVGGIIGLAECYQYQDWVLPEFRNCLNAGEISGYENVGGIAGGTEKFNVTFFNCLSVGKISGRNGHSNICADGDKKNCYYKSNTYSTKVNGETGVTEEQLKSGQIAYWLNEGDISADAPWRQTIGTDDYPKLGLECDVITSEKFGNRININTAEELMEFALTVNSGTKPSYIVNIGHDIDLTGCSNWIPIGTDKNRFVGLVYGNGHTISNLICNFKTKGAGLFGNIGNRTEIHDIILDASCSIRSESVGVGGIAGCAEDASGHDGSVVISGCGNMATIEGKYDVGGIIGAVYSDSEIALNISNCFNASLSISSTDPEKHYAAAICGFAKDNAVIDNCWNIGVIHGFVKGEAFVRGNNTQIHNCHQYEEWDKDMKQTGVDSLSFQDILDGTLCFKLNGGSNITNDISAQLPWEQDLGTVNSYPVPAAFGSQRHLAVYYTRNVKSEFGTIVLPFDVESNDSIQYYLLDGTVNENNSLRFISTDVVTAGTPALFRTKATGNIEFISSNYTFEYVDLNTTKIQPVCSDWAMQGTYRELSFTNSEELRSIYYISGDNIRNASKSLSIGSFRAYLTYRSDSPAKVMSIVFDDDVTTGISLIPAYEQPDPACNVHGTDIYSTGGQQLPMPADGICIIDSRKFYIR